MEPKMTNSNTTQAYPDPLMLRFSGALVEQLGAQMYPSATATVAELISNSWDADARHVWVQIPLGETWDASGKIEVLDDGHGMTREQAQNMYLIVGRKRRLSDKGKTPNGRLVHGRKGIGKLAAFGTAEVLDCYTVTQGNEAVSFQLDYHKIRKMPAGSDCPVEEIQQDSLVDIEGKPLLNGTRVRLSGLKLKRAISAERFMRSMSRRFSIDQTEMQVFINGEPLKRFDTELAYRYPRDNTPSSSVTVGQDGWGTEELENGKNVRWWIGFTPKPIDAEYLRGISILGRGKLLQRPFLFDSAGGTTGQVGQEYIVGEVEADWLDYGVDIEDDLIQTNRDQLQLEDERVQSLLEWGRERVRWALRQRANARRQDVDEKITTSPDISKLLEPFTKTEQRIFFEIAEKASEIGDPDPEDVHDFMVEVVNAHKDKAVRELMEKVKVEDYAFQTRFWGLVREFSLIDARKNLSIIQARLETIDRLDEAVKAGATEVPEIHNIIKEFPWLIDPRWNLLGDEIDPASLSETYEPLIDEETRERIDFLFMLQPKSPANIDEVLVVEIKRGMKSNRKLHRVSEGEVQKFHSYVLGVREHYETADTRSPTVHGLMIANAYSQRANRLRQSLSQSQDVHLDFQSWDTIIEKTRRLHTSWLEVTSKSVSSG